MFALNTYTHYSNRAVHRVLLQDLRLRPRPARASLRTPTKIRNLKTESTLANDKPQRDNSMLTFEQSPFLGTANIVAKLQVRQTRDMSKPHGDREKRG